MIRTVLNKLDSAHASYCETLSQLIARFKENGATAERERRSGELRGYLQCLCDVGVITQAEVQKLFLWYSSEDRHKEG